MTELQFEKDMTYNTRYNTFMSPYDIAFSDDVSENRKRFFEDIVQRENRRNPDKKIFFANFLINPSLSFEDLQNNVNFNDIVSILDSEVSSAIESQQQFNDLTNMISQFEHGVDENLSTELNEELKQKLNERWAQSQYGMNFDALPPQIQSIVSRQRCIECFV